MIYSPEKFTVTDREVLLKLIRENSFATLIASNGDDPMVAHIPVLLDEKSGVLRAHVARANPLWQQLRPDHEVLLIFHGPHYYISPSCYSVHPSVPTWNYAVVHVHGFPAIVEDGATVESMLRELVQTNESRTQSPWQMELPDDYLKKMIGAIVAFEVRVSRMQGKFKLSQNRPAVDRANVVATLEQAGNDDAARLAALMRQVVEL